tara:strand:+ start:29 stop:724 length:696 start_codon:yes stop_codon:yes gene_type:complete
MASFETQVNGLTGLGATLSSSTTPTDTELDQFLKDGVLDVTRRTIEVRPQDTYKFIKESSEKTSNTSSPLDLNGAKIISVVRESGTNDDWRECRLITPSMQSRVTDTDSLDFASSFNPAYSILDNGQINVFPAPSAGGSNSFKVYYVNNLPQDKGGNTLDHTHSDIKYFADDRVYLVVIYAAIKCLEAKMAEYTIDEEDSELVQTLGTNLANLKQQYESAFAGMKPPVGGR